jgi:hypothetical protein
MQQERLLDARIGHVVPPGSCLPVAKDAVRLIGLLKRLLVLRR